MTITCTAISVATTFVMSTAARRRELTALRLTGATPRQLTTMIVVEGGLVVLAAVALAGLATAVVLALTAAVLAGTGPLVLSVPWVWRTEAGLGHALAGSTGAWISP